MTLSQHKEKRLNFLDKKIGGSYTLYIIEDTVYTNIGAAVVFGGAVCVRCYQ